MHQQTDLSHLIGKVFWKVTILEIVSARNNGGRLMGLCECGTIKEFSYYKLRTGNIKSCGCGKGNNKHGLSSSQIYKKYQSMKQRCMDSNNISFYRYGGRGIKICEEWLNNFEEFNRWSMANGYSDDLSLERIDVHGDYCPENCKWIQPIEQYKNKDWENHIRKTGKEVLQIDLDTHKVIAVFAGVKAAERHIGVKGIDNVLRGKCRHAGGYYWRYADMKDEKQPRRRRNLLRVGIS